jgi:hypothetical protein
MITAAGAGVSQLRRLMFISAAALLALLCGLSMAPTAGHAGGAQLQAMMPDLYRVLGAG